MKIKPALSFLAVLVFASNAIADTYYSHPVAKWEAEVATLLVANEGGDPPATPIHPDLQVEPATYNAQVLQEIQRRSRELSNTALSGITPATIHIPDYKFAYQALQNNIAIAMANYFAKMESINDDVKLFYSKIEALRLQSLNSPLFVQLLNRELVQETPKIYKTINNKYSEAIRELYLLNGMSNAIEMKNKKNQSINQLKIQQNAINASNTLYRYCKTAACVLQLSEDIKGWNKFVQHFNQPIDFVNFPARTQWTLGNVSTTPLITVAVTDYAARLARGIEVNRQYNIASYMGAIAQVPAGIAIEIVAAPLYIFEKLALFTKKLLTSHRIRLELKLNALDAYEPSEVNAKLKVITQPIADKLPTVIFDEVVKNEMMRALDVQLKKESASLINRFPAIFSEPVVINPAPTNNAGNNPSNGPTTIPTTGDIKCEKLVKVDAERFVCTRPYKVASDGRSIHFSNRIDDNTFNTICSGLGLVSRYSKSTPFKFDAPKTTNGTVSLENAQGLGTLDEVTCVQSIPTNLPKYRGQSSQLEDGTVIINDPRLILKGIEVPLAAKYKDNVEFICQYLGFSTTINKELWESKDDGPYPEYPVRDAMARLGFFAYPTSATEIQAQSHVRWWTKIACK